MTGYDDDKGTSTYNRSLLTLTSDGNGHFHGNGDLAMSGQWQIIVQISTPSDPDHFHEAYTVFSTP